MTEDLLLEIGTEELPPKALLPLSQAFAASFADQLKKANLAFTDIEPFATPRRLALRVQALATQQADSAIERFGPALQAAFDSNGNATKAAEGFARSCGVTVAELEQAQDGKVTKLVFRSTRKGAAASTLIPDLLRNALTELPIPKRMRWGSSRDEFVRPVHWVVLLFGHDVIPATILGATADKKTYGHRFHHPAAIALSSPADYATALHAGKVVANFSERRAQIRTQVEALAAQLGARAIIDEALLDEVAALVEWPVALAGNFDHAFLEVPKEALISSMKEHQKCFHLLDDGGRILPHFITVSNLESRDPAQVVAGNEKVIRPRLADAAFFFTQDKRQPLASRIDKLKSVVFQQALGTLFDKSQRVRSLATWLAGELDTSVAQAQRAAELGKCDLMTSMVYEFAELQGVMGEHYARHDGEPDAVCSALFEQYLPRFAGDRLPATRTGMVLALAERLDTITGLFAIGQPPTGSKDPFALRRAALGVLRIIVESKLPLDLRAAITHATAAFHAQAGNENPVRTVEDFIFERFRAWYADEGVGVDVFLAVDAVRPTQPLEFDARIKAVSHFATLPEARALAAANKRVSNILDKSISKDSEPYSPNLLQAGAEQSLATTLQQVQATVEPLLQRDDFTFALAEMASLQQVVDAYFEEVMVNVDDPDLRRNRLALLSSLRGLFLRVADISQLQHV